MDSRTPRAVPDGDTLKQLQTARSILQQSRRTAVFSGAGLSAESGIPTFRDPDPQSLWARFDPMKLASIEGFNANPQRVMDWYDWRRTQLAEVAPNAGHIALAEHRELLHVTQNVDNLLERAGVAPHRIHHLHGEISRNRCVAECGFEQEIALENPPGLVPCPQCGRQVRPCVVWFGEALPQTVWQAAEKLCRRVDCLLVVGTSASVYPAAGLIGLARECGSRIIEINPAAGEADPAADVELRGGSAQILPPLLHGLQLQG